MQGSLEKSTEEQKNFLFINRSDVEVVLRLPDGTIRAHVLPKAAVALGSSPNQEVVVQINLASGDLTHTIVVAPGQVIYFEKRGLRQPVTVTLAERPENEEE